MMKRKKKLKIASIITGVLSSLFAFGPALFYTVEAFFNASESQKYILTISLVISAMLCLVNIIAKVPNRSVLLVLLVGITSTSGVDLPIVLIAIAYMVDEFLLFPLHEMYKKRYEVRKELEKE